MNHFSMFRCARFCLCALMAVGVSLEAGSRTSTEGAAWQKLDSALRSNVESAGAGGLTPQSVSTTEIKTVRVEVRLKRVDSITMQRLRSLGLVVESQFRGLLTGRIAANRLLNLAALDAVATIHPWQRGHTRSVQGEGITALRADKVHLAHPSFDGTGIKIGILSDSFGMVSEATPVIEDVDGDGIDEISGTDSQLSGDLPETVELLKEGELAEGEENYFIDEGRAMAELIHEIAPGAELAFYTAAFSKADFATGILALAQAGCQVIVDDVGYSDQSPFQDDEVSQAISQAEQEFDVVYLTALGNDALGALEGSFFDIDPENEEGLFTKFPNGSNFHDWSGGGNSYLPLIIEPSDEVVFILQWQDPMSGLLGPGASTDYDLYLLASQEFLPSNILALSDSYQGFPEAPAGDPIEGIYFKNESEFTQTVYLVLNKHHGPDAYFKLYTPFSNTPSYPSWVRSRDAHVLYGHPLSADALSVAAVNFHEILSEGKAESNPFRIEPEFFSSLGGPASLYFSPSGSVLSAPEVRIKPDIACVDGTNTSFFYDDTASDPDDLPNFYGTSASAPHAAAIVALMRQANPQLKASEIRRIARAAATDIFETGVDRYTGHGLLYADEAVKAALTPQVDSQSADPPVPVKSVLITDTLATEEDLSNKQDWDSAEQRSLVIRWNLPDTDLTDIHVYVSVDSGSPQYLGRTASGISNAMEWKAEQTNLNSIFQDGPQFNHTYRFQVYGLRIGKPFVGPYSSKGPVQYLEYRP